MVLSKQFKQLGMVLAVLVTASLGFGSFASSHEGAERDHRIGANAGDACVRETEWMRRNHMELLQHDRDRTLRMGIRPVDGSLKGCVDCHANKDDQGHFIPVDAEGEFCAGCHAYTAVSLDCFECHATRPESERAAK